MKLILYRSYIYLNIERLIVQMPIKSDDKTSIVVILGLQPLNFPAFGTLTKQQIVTFNKSAGLKNTRKH